MYLLGQASNAIIFVLFSVDNTVLTTHRDQLQSSSRAISHSIAQPSFQDDTDFENAEQGHVASLETCSFANENGHNVWNNEDYAFIQAVAHQPSIRSFGDEDN